MNHFNHIEQLFLQPSTRVDFWQWFCLLVTNLPVNFWKRLTIKNKNRFARAYKHKSLFTWFAFGGSCRVTLKRQSPDWSLDKSIWVDESVVYTISLFPDFNEKSLSNRLKQSGHRNAHAKHDQHVWFQNKSPVFNSVIGECPMDTVHQSTLLRVINDSTGYPLSGDIFIENYSFRRVIETKIKIRLKSLSVWKFYFKARKKENLTNAFVGGQTNVLINLCKNLKSRNPVLKFQIQKPSIFIE